MGVEIVGSIDELLPKVDVVLLESVDGRPHLAQARPVIAAGKPLFIDKPMAASLADAMEIFRLAKEKQVPCFSSSCAALQLRVSGDPAEEVAAGRRQDLRGLEPAAPGAAPSRSLLVRHSRRGDPLHDHGSGLQDGDPRGAGQGRRRLGRRPPGTFVAKKDYGAQVEGSRGAGLAGSSRAISRWWSRSSASSGRASRR